MKRYGSSLKAAAVLLAAVSAAYGQVTQPTLVPPAETPGPSPAAPAQEALAPEAPAPEAPAPAADGRTGDDEPRADPQFDLGDTVVTAGRREQSITQVPMSVTVVDREAINEQSTISGDMGDILGKTVPGLSLSTGGFSNFGQSLRGRKFAVLIDGVPQSTPLRDAFRDLRTIHPSALERVEVVRGATAIYGYGAAGGIINYITKRPEEGKFRLTTEAGFRFSTEHPDDSLSPFVMQQASGKVRKFDFLLNGYYERTNSLYDADGDMIPPDPQQQGGLADSNQYNLFGKFGYDLTPDQRIQFTAHRYFHRQDSDYITSPGIIDEEKATAVRGENPGENPGTENNSFSLDYSHADVLASRLHAQVFYQDFETFFAYSTFFPGGGGQSLIDSEKFGTRLSLETPLPWFDGLVTWGVDYLNDKSQQPLVDGRDWVPEMDQESVGIFAQLEVPVTEQLLLRGGVRHEEVWVDVGDFTTLFAGNFVRGGELDYNATLFNLGAVYSVTDNIDIFGGWSEGFSVTEVGRELRATVAPTVELLKPEAELVDSYELGVRGRWDRFAFSAVGFYSKSDGGTTFGPAPTFELIRSPEEIWGVEGTVDVKVTDDLIVGGNASWVEGKRDVDDDGDLDEYLPGDRIPPLKVVAFVEHQTLPGWKNRLQAVYSGSRDRFEGSTVFGEGDVDSFITFDLYSAVELGRGTLKLGVENLFNQDYYPPASQFFNLPIDYTKAQGRTVTVAYEITW